MVGRRSVVASLGCLLVAGGTASSLGSEAFTSTVASRGANVSTEADDTALIGLVVSDSVKKNNQERLVDVDNNTEEPINVTVSLDECTDGELYGPYGQGCSVDLTIDPGLTGSVDINADVSKVTLPFDIAATSSTLSFEATRSTEAVAGNADAPDAEAGGPYEVNEGETVTLDGTNNNGKIQQYDWEIVSGPGTLTDSSTATPEYHAPEVSEDTDVTVELTVTDNKGLTGTDQATITVNETVLSPPTFDSLSVTTTGNQNRNFQIEADVSDSDGDLDRVEITVIRLHNNSSSYQSSTSVIGFSDSVSDTSNKLQKGEQFEIRVEVFDVTGRSSIEIRTLSTG